MSNKVTKAYKKHKKPDIAPKPTQSPIPRSVNSTSIIFNDQQQHAYNGISAILDEDRFICVLNAVAGSGKSAIVKQIIRDNPDKNFHVVSLAAVAAMPYSDLSTDEHGEITTKAQSVFGNLFTQDIPNFSKERLHDWQRLQNELCSGLYVPHMQVDEENSETVINEMVSSNAAVKKSFGMDFFEWFTCHVLIHAHDKWKDRYDGSNDSSDKKNWRDAILIVEEYSMVSILSLLGWMYPRVILVGDKNQLPAIESLPEPNAPYTEPFHSLVGNAYDCFHDMVQDFGERFKSAKYFTLTKNERDPSHQDWYDWLYDAVRGHAQEPNESVQCVINHISYPINNIRNEVNAVPVENDVIYLCDKNDIVRQITNKYHALFRGSVRVMRPIPAECSPEDTYHFLEHPATKAFAGYCVGSARTTPNTIMQLIDMICSKYSRYVQAVVIGGSVMIIENKKGEFYNGEIYPIIEKEGKMYIGDIKELPYATLKSTGDARMRINQWIDILGADRIPIQIKVPIFREANVMTIHKSQGQSITGKVAVVITSDWFCSRQMLYTAATRCRNVENLRIYADKPFDEKFTEMKRASASLEKLALAHILNNK
jgi:hypothetical protein